ncbi:MAG: aldehyde dehydrogenase family protein [Polyangiaceae bacterium]|nr:aldehyde dehydrogenase family protein [Polyangiaceae bacterium]
MQPAKLLASLGLDPHAFLEGDLVARSPIDGSMTARLSSHDEASVDAAIERAHAAFLAWRAVPAPRRGELVRLFGEELRKEKEALAAIVTLEAGKIVAEARGEVQEMIDICDFACGLSRQLYGLTIASERPGHRMSESWHPLGVVGVISAFNFPVAVWAWNFTLALVCGNAVVWKPSEKAPLCAAACQAIFGRAVARFAEGGSPAPEGLSGLVQGGAVVGERLADDRRVALVSATGSTRMGRALAPRVAARFGRVLLELGGNNAMIVAPSADLELATRAILFSAAGTCGQRCTTLRRLIAHESVRDELVRRVRGAYAQLRVGDPREASTLVGPLIDGPAFEAMSAALRRAEAEGGAIVGGERVAVAGLDGGFYVRPALATMPGQTDIVRTETFAPILYAMSYRELDEAIATQNDVPQGLSSCIFTNDLREAERFVSAEGSDCGIANVNIGPSGAEIGGAFGGEKETGGGRESGSDAWRAYMRRATNTVNYSKDLPLAQGIVFG